MSRQLRDGQISASTMKLVFPWVQWGARALLVDKRLWKLMQCSSSLGKAKAMGREGLLGSQRAKENSMLKEKEKEKVSGKQNGKGKNPGKTNSFQNGQTQVSIVITVANRVIRRVNATSFRMIVAKVVKVQLTMQLGRLKKCLLDMSLHLLPMVLHPMLALQPKVQFVC